MWKKNTFESILQPLGQTFYKEPKKKKKAIILVLHETIVFPHELCYYSGQVQERIINMICHQNGMCQLHQSYTYLSSLGITGNLYVWLVGIKPCQLRHVKLKYKAKNKQV